VASEPEHIRSLQKEHASLWAQGAPLLAESMRMEEIEGLLASLGAEPDKALAVKIARERIAAGQFIIGPLTDPDLLSALQEDGENT